jgi:hypothetical protein
VLLPTVGLRGGMNKGTAGAALGAKPKSLASLGAAEGAVEKLAFLGFAAGPESRLTRREAGTMQVTLLSCSALGILTTVDAA